MKLSIGVFLILELLLLPTRINASGFIHSNTYQTSDAYSPNPSRDPYTIEFFTRCDDDKVGSAWLNFWNGVGVLIADSRYYNYLIGDIYFSGVTCNNQWQHVALVKTSSNIRIYIRGELKATIVGSSQLNSSPWIFQNMFGTYDLDSYRVSDYDRYTSNFQTPLKELIRDSHTLKLFLYNNGIEYADQYGNWVFDDQHNYAQWLQFGEAPETGGVPSQNIQGDANDDGKVDADDFVIWIDHYNQNFSGSATGDFNSDANVDGLDYSIWLHSYGT